MTLLMAKRWLVTGASGLLGHALIQHLSGQGRTVTGVVNRHNPGLAAATTIQADLCSAAVEDLLADHPQVVVHAAGLTNVDQCETDEASAHQLHAETTARLARHCRVHGIRFVYISTDHLWDGTRAWVDENTPTSPLNAYARTKLAGEQAALRENSSCLVIRTNFFGPGLPWRRSFSDWIIDELAAGKPVVAFSDVFFTPIAYDLLCPMLISLADSQADGIWHLAGGERLSKHDFALRLARHTGFDAGLIVEGRMADSALRAARPYDMSLDTQKAAAFFGAPMPDVDASLATLRPNISIQQKV